MQDLEGYTAEELTSLKELYRHELLNDCMAFWREDLVDREYGGYMTHRDRDGTVIDTDKGIWQQGRTAWMTASIFNQIDPDPYWLEISNSGIQFLLNHGFDADGRMFFHVTRDGRPIRKRRYYYSECFAALAFAANAKASGNDQYRIQALKLFEKCMDYFRNPGQLPPKNEPTRPAISIGPPMILLNVAQNIRATLNPVGIDDLIDSLIDYIQKYFVKPDLECVMELVAPDGAVINHSNERTLNPGHAIECAWFILQEARVRKSKKLTDLGCQMLDWMWNRGWDNEFGGIFYFRDLDNKPVSEYWHDMKFWWVHCEAEIAALLAWKLTGIGRYAQWHKSIHQYNRKTFHDPEFGEWFGYIHRDGRISSTLKGNLWKGPFHLPRMLMFCSDLLNDPDVSSPE